jgi:hypothetical protein
LVVFTDDFEPPPLLLLRFTDVAGLLQSLPPFVAAAAAARVVVVVVIVAPAVIRGDELLLDGNDRGDPFEECEAETTEERDAMVVGEEDVRETAGPAARGELLLVCDETLPRRPITGDGFRTTDLISDAVVVVDVAVRAALIRWVPVGCAVVGGSPPALPPAPFTAERG